MKTVLISDLPRGICGIYKITFPNNKIYIGKSNDIKRRCYEHNRLDREDILCDKMIHKYYGQLKEITILEECLENELNEREKYWIKYYNSTNKKIGYNCTEGGEYNSINHRSFNREEVLQIRKRRFNGESKIKVYQDYKDKNFQTFEKIWLGITWPQVGKQYIITPHTISKQEDSSKANQGENNNKAKLTEQQVRNIRQLYKDGKDITTIWKQYSFVSRETIKRVCLYQTWKHIK